MIDLIEEKRYHDRVGSSRNSRSSSKMYVKIVNYCKSIRQTNMQTLADGQTDGQTDKQ